MGKDSPSIHHVLLLLELDVLSKTPDDLLLLLVFDEPVEVDFEQTVLLDQNGLASQVDHIAVEHETPAPLREGLLLHKRRMASF